MFKLKIKLNVYFENEFANVFYDTIARYSGPSADEWYGKKKKKKKFLQ